MLVYGNAFSIPKILVFVSKVVDIYHGVCENTELEDANKAFSIARYLNLPFLFVRFMVNSDKVAVWEANFGQWRILTYDELRNIFEKYGVVQPGTAGKRVNQYTSSSYHDWQRNQLGRITVSDFDLIKFTNQEVKEIVELKRSKISLNSWSPYEADYPNFALLINTIVGSKKQIPFFLYYNVMRAGERGMREEDISQLKVFEFITPGCPEWTECDGRMISCKEVRYKFKGFYRPEEILK